MKQFNHFFFKHFSAVFALSLVLVFSLGCFKSDEEWKSILAHKKLSAAKTSGSVSDKVEFYFCPNGEYAKSTEFIGNSGGFSMADQDVEFGRWTVESGTLVLHSEQGKSSQYSISQGTDSNVIRLNDIGYLVTQHNKCGN